MISHDITHDINRYQRISSSIGISIDIIKIDHPFGYCSQSIDHLSIDRRLDTMISKRRSIDGLLIEVWIRWVSSYTFRNARFQTLKFESGRCEMFATPALNLKV